MYSRYVCRIRNCPAHRRTICGISCLSAVEVQKPTVSTLIWAAVSREREQPFSSTSTTASTMIQVRDHDTVVCFWHTSATKYDLLYVLLSFCLTVFGRRCYSIGGPFRSLCLSERGEKKVGSIFVDARHGTLSNEFNSVKIFLKPQVVYISARRQDYPRRVANLKLYPLCQIP